VYVRPLFVPRSAIAVASHLLTFPTNSMQDAPETTATEQTEVPESPEAEEIENAAQLPGTTESEGTGIATGITERPTSYSYSASTLRQRNIPLVEKVATKTTNVVKESNTTEPLKTPVDDNSAFECNVCLTNA
jgi:hypothetical protein